MARIKHKTEIVKTEILNSIKSLIWKVDKYKVNYFDILTSLKLLQQDVRDKL